jgi:hypothetical protein
MATLKEDFLSEGYIIGHRFFSNSSMFLFITLRARHIVFDVSRLFQQFAHFLIMTLAHFVLLTTQGWPSSILVI